MKVLCCPAIKRGMFNPNTRECLERLTPAADIIDVSGDPNAYWNSVRDRWDGGNDLVVVEHDIVFTADDLESFNSCPYHWCTFAYNHYRDDPRTILTEGLGFTRFRAHMMSKIPVSQIPCTSDGSIHWLNLDARIAATARRFGFWPPHVHGWVDHYHERDELRYG